MELKKGEITSYSSANILKNYLFILKRLYKDYSYLGIEHNKFNKMVLDEIELSKNEYDGSVLYSVYLKERLNKYLLAYINNLMKEEVNAFKIINNYINLNFNGPKTDDYVLYYLTKLDEFFSNLDYIPEPDPLINIVNR